MHKYICSCCEYPCRLEREEKFSDIELQNAVCLVEPERECFWELVRDIFGED